MKYMSRKTIIVASALAFCLTLTLLGVRGASTTAKTPAPTGQWSIGYHGYMGNGFQSLPVVVFSVTSHVDKGVTDVFVKNNASDPVTAVKLRWSLATDTRRNEILRQGETPLITLKQSLQPNARLKLNYHAVRFEDIYEPFAGGGKVDGDFRIEIAVSEVKFASGSTWKWGDPFFSKVSFRKPEGKCANQTCKNVGGVYNCVDGAGELCTNSGDSCNSSLCDLIID